jgi:DNA (cytosine-5)-methyltransferase 1
VGRSKLREIETHPQAFKRDPRARLYLEYLRYVDAFQPLVILLENVPDVLNHGGQNIAEDIFEVLETKGYVTRYTLLNAAFYGVPQMRERMFLIGYPRELNCPVTFPQRTHWVDLPSGYEGSRSVALKRLDRKGPRHQLRTHLSPPQENQSQHGLCGAGCGYQGSWRRYLAGQLMDYDLGYIDLEEKTLQPLHNPFGPKV